jgi:hypothetical protein
MMAPWNQVRRRASTAGARPPCRRSGQTTTFVDQNKAADRAAYTRDLALFLVIDRKLRGRDVRNSGHDRNDLCIGREATNCLLRAGNAVIDADLKDAPAGASQGHLRVWSELTDEVRRRTGARFIVSLAAVLDFHAHRRPSFACEP